MAFSTGILTAMDITGSGELYTGASNIVLAATTFESGLKVGRFAKMDSGSLDNMDGSASPVIAGVVLRNPANTYEDGSTITTTLHEVVEYANYGLVSVEAKAGESPTFGDMVYASNAGDANDGLAMVTTSGEPTGCRYIETLNTNQWLIVVDGLHMGAAAGITVADTGAFTSNSDVEAVIAEMLPATSQIAAIADPGDAGAIAVTRSGVCALTTAGAETRTIAVPASVGIKLAVICDTYVGDAVVTVASTVNQTGNNTLTFGAVADMIVLESMTVGGSIVWRVTANDGVALSTV